MHTRTLPPLLPWVARLAAWGACLLAPQLGLAAPPAEVSFPAEQIEFFEKEVRPVLATRCYECHSAGAKKIEGNLLLDSRAAVLKGGDSGPSAVPGKAATSLLIDAVNYGETYQMPPKKKLPAHEVAALTKWVELGLPWPPEAASAAAAKPTFDIAQRMAEHWAWRPLVAPPVPAVKNGAWPAGDIDRFALAKMEEHGLEPAPPAESLTLLRRLTFDLVGLPPTPAQVQAIQADDSPEGVARLVDQLLESPQYGERWGRHWLDLMRYAESRGHEFDYSHPNAWQYRDYVIRALNADVPYDQFLTEHLAGDLLTNPRLNPATGGNESILGTGFWFLGEWVHSPVDIRKDETDRHDNMLDVMTKTFLGLTVACARCHDHKFDAISQADYYALAGYLQSTGYRQVHFQSDVKNGAIARQLGELRSQVRLTAGKNAAARNAPALEKLAAYLESAHAVLSQGGREKPTPERMAQLAAATQLDGALLKRWIERLAAAGKNPADVFYPLAGVPAAGDHAAHAAAQQAEFAKQAAARSEGWKDVELIVDFGACGPDDFFAAGPLFAAGPTRLGELETGAGPSAPLSGAATRGGVRPDPAFAGLADAPGTDQGAGAAEKLPRTGRTFRTRTFGITAGPVYYLVRGSGWAFAAVDSHHMVQGPLHGQVLRTFDSKGELSWIAHDLSAYREHRVHIEFTPNGNGPFEVVAVAQGAHAPPPLATSGSPTIMASLAQQPECPTSVAEWARWFQARLHEANQRLQAGSSPAAPNDSRANAELMALMLDVLVREPELFFTGEKPAPGEPAAEVAQLYATMKQVAAGIQNESPAAPAMWEGSRDDERFLYRGLPTRPGDAIPRRLLTALGGEQHPLVAQGSGRLELVRHLLDPSNPFPARVMANRVWHHLFGRGLVPTVDNFGVLGERPTHPELLDHLATQLVREGWSVKRLIRSVVLSRVYQESSAASGAAREHDPANRWFSHTNLRRLEAEAVRDSILAVSGRLNLQAEGPSVPVFLTPFMEGRGRPAGGPLDGDGRRSVYLSVRRNFLSPMMLAFDMPQPIGAMGRRYVSNVPAQALTLMNDPFVVGEARRWAQKTLREGGSTVEDRLRFMVQAALARSPSEAELAEFREFLAQQGASYKLAGDLWQTHEKVWTDLAHTLFNLKEFIYLR